VKWAEKTIFVTGATGFIGARICERLVQAGARDIRALVHTLPRAARIARLPITLCPGDLLDRSSLEPAMGESRVVIHCGLAPARGIVRTTENMLQVAEARGVERFVHISTAAVHGLTPPPGTESEEARPQPSGDAYCDNKVRAEKLVARFSRRGFPAVILRPSIVYGPYSAWSTRLIADLRARRTVLIDGGRGACNTTYVDNLVDAIFLSLENDRAVGEIFFVTDGERVTWGDFIRAHAAMMDPPPELKEISANDVLAYYQRQPGLLAGSFRATGEVVRSREFRKLLERIPLCERSLAMIWRWLQSRSEEQREKLRFRLGLRASGVQNGMGHAAPPIPDPVTFATQTGTVFFRIDKARRLLGYEPRIPFSRAIGLVEQWLRFANYLPEEAA
jgi:nucleoside-diphosphate-sugar epimerase